MVVVFSALFSYAPRINKTIVKLKNITMNTDARILSTYDNRL